MLSSHTVEKRDNNNAINNALKLAHTQNDSNVFAHMLQLIYITHTYTAKAWLSFCASTDLRDAANQSIFLIFRPIYTHRNHTQSSNSTWISVELVYDIHIYITKTQLSFCTFTRLRDAVNRSVFCFIRSIYMHRNHIHCKDMTQSLIIYTERQQRLCACAATNIRHSHSHCKDTTQLLRTYTSVQRSKSINFSIFWSIYMHRKYIDQNSSSSFSWVIIQRTQKLTSKWSAFIYIDQSSSSSLSLMIIQTSWKLMSKWSAFIILTCLYDHLVI